ncbi:MAG: MBL fold metallo-hydrolase [Lachnospiraceae bacterium]|nr:MBL fold metallo-hydrolase [Lachnospiraceae bacterium]
MRLFSIASGSSGNAVFVGEGSTNILIDAGISAKRIKEGLSTIGLSLKDLSAVLITHEHIDHIKGLSVLARQGQMPIYATDGTIGAILSSFSGKGIDPGLFKTVDKDRAFEIGELSCLPIGISHDAADPVSYRFFRAGSADPGHDSSMAVMTDLGTYDDYIVDSLSGVGALLLESNHDVRVLEAGPYPYPLKRRILGRYGHLSNEGCGELLTRLMEKRPGALSQVLLGHLSRENNYPELAFQTVKQIADQYTASHLGKGLQIGIAARDHRSPEIEVK